MDIHWINLWIYIYIYTTNWEFKKEKLYCYTFLYNLLKVLKYFLLIVIDTEITSYVIFLFLQILYDITPMWNLKNNKWTCLQNKSRPKFAGSKLKVTEGEAGVKLRLGS